eukprot:10670635-Alexandrium_andersonii.AAC.1
MRQHASLHGLAAGVPNADRCCSSCSIGARQHRAAPQGARGCLPNPEMLSAQGADCTRHRHCAVLGALHGGG